MPIRSQPYDFPSEKQEQPQNEKNDPAPGQEIGLGTGIHERKSEWAKRFAPEGEPKEKAYIIEEQSERSSPWLVFMIISIVSALILFMMIPVLENFFQKEGPNNFFENIKAFISFAAPVIVVVSAIAGTAGYFFFKRAAWLTVLGLLTGAILFIATFHGTAAKLNFGIYWILMGSFFGGFAGSIYEFIYQLRKRHNKEILPVIIIAGLAFLVGGFFLVQNTVSRKVELYDYAGVARTVNFAVYQPAYLPDKVKDIQPKIFIDDGQVSVYYGNDQYPPPPVIDFLTGIEIIESKRITDIEEIIDPEPGIVFVDIGDATARFSERRGRGTLEWNQDDTHIVLNIYSNIPAREMFKIARTMQVVPVTREKK